MCTALHYVNGTSSFQLYVIAHTEEAHTDLHITEDGGDTFEDPLRLPFLLGGDIIFHPNDDPTKYDYMLANCSISGVGFVVYF